jgi:hypothetical protein
VEREQVLKTLQDDVTDAKQRLDGANRAFDDVIPDIPGMLPHSAASLRWHPADKECVS